MVHSDIVINVFFEALLLAYQSEELPTFKTANTITKIFTRKRMKKNNFSEVANIEQIYIYNRV
jgi:hypothetical protein